MKPYVCHLNKKKSSKLSTIRELRITLILAIRTDMKKRKEYYLKMRVIIMHPSQSTHRFRHGILSDSPEQETYRYLDMCYQDFTGNFHVSAPTFDGKLKEQIDLQWGWEKEPIFLPVPATLRPPGM